MKNIILFGASKLGEIAYDFLKDKYNILNFCDNNKQKAGQYFHGIKIISFQELMDLVSCRDFEIIISSQYSNEIKAQLIQNGIKKFRDFIYLPYLELHLTDHCNLNCKGCSHFCPIADKNYLSMGTYLKDMKRMAMIFESILTIRLMGGEPLLHPNIVDFVKATRYLFPKSLIAVVTNGILLPQMSSEFYEALRDNQITLDVTVYPILQNKIEMYLSKAEEYGISVRQTVADKFFSMINIKGDSDKENVFNECPIKYCTFLREGKLYTCTVAANSQIINKTFGWTIPGDDCIDIYEAVTDIEILEFLAKPIATCAYCSQDVKWFPWEISKRNMKEWLV